MIVETHGTRVVPIETYLEIDSLSEKIRLGRASLRVLTYPWGVDFEVVETPS